MPLLQNLIGRLLGRPQAKPGFRHIDVGAQVRGELEAKRASEKRKLGGRVPVKIR